MQPMNYQNKTIWNIEEMINDRLILFRKSRLV